MTKRCFILGNSPSILEEDLSLIEDDDIFICNRGYKIKDIQGFDLKNIKYYILADKKHARNFGNEIEEKTKDLYRYFASNLDNPVVLTQFSNNYIFFKRLPNKIFSKFPKSFNEGWGRTKNVVADAVIIAYFLGYKEIYLLGVDLDYSNENNHFYEDSKFEIKYKNNVPNSLEDILNSFKIISNSLKEKDIVFKNLSKKFTYSRCIERTTLQEITNEAEKK